MYFLSLKPPPNVFNYFMSSRIYCTKNATCFEPFKDLFDFHTFVLKTFSLNDF